MIIFTLVFPFPEGIGLKPAMVCILGIGLYLSIRTGFIQIRKFGLAMKETFGKIFTKGEKKEGAIPNLIGVFLLSGTVVKLVKNYFSGDEYIPYHERAKMLRGDK